MEVVLEVHEERKHVLWKHLSACALGSQGYTDNDISAIDPLKALYANNFEIIMV